MGEIPVERNQLIIHLDENLGFLSQSCKSFDANYLSEAKRLAVTIRVLLHDTKNSKSLLQQLGVKNTIGYYDTATPYTPKNLFVYHGLVYLGFSHEGLKYVAPLERSIEMDYKPNVYIPFSEWWKGIIIKDKEGITYTREDLVKILANKDGGAHVDPKITSDYDELRKSNRMIIWGTSSEVENMTGMTDLELHSMRQIAFELLKSIDKIRPTL